MLLRIVASLLLLVLARGARAELPTCELNPQQPGIYVLTVQPGDGVPNAFGHTALLVWNPRAGMRSAVFDYGRYRAAPITELAWKMLRMELPYFMSADPLGNVLARYKYENRQVIAQRLSLTSAEAGALVESQREQTKDPEFPYHWYSTNCTTKVRDAIDAAMGGVLKAQHESEVSDTSACREVLRHSAPMWPLWFGLHWGSGRTADEPISEWDAMYLPDGFRRRVEESTRPDGSPLVVETCELVSSTRAAVPAEPPNRNLVLWLFGLLAAAGLYGLSRVGRGAGLAGVGVLGAAIGVFGSTAVLIGSLGTFAPFWGWHNQWFANPLWLALVPAAWIAWRNAASDWPMRLAGAVVGVAGLGVLAFLVRGLADRNFGIMGLAIPVLLVAAWLLRPEDR